MQAYEFGKSYPVEGIRDIVAGPPIAPIWFALIVPPQKERATCEHLRHSNVFAFFPERERTWRVRGKTIRRKFPIVSTYIYAQFRRQPAWHIMKEHRRLITGVFAINGIPVKIQAPVIKHLQGLAVDAVALEEARHALRLLKQGDKAKFISGVLDGFTVDIDRVEGGEVWFNSLLCGRGKTTAQSLSRIITPAEEDKVLKSVLDDVTTPAKTGRDKPEFNAGSP